ncbi:MAG: radical SAM protein, partial [Flavitalea sp.]
MAGIYIHIPFCKQACHYCNFHFSTSLKLKNDFLECLLKEIPLQANYLSGAPIHTVYFGGGTPSLLSKPELDQVFEMLHKNYQISADAEITFETNPDDVNAGVLSEWRSLGINRLSLGVQSFYEEDLQWMNRAHSSGQALRS